ncbi:MAG: Rrf2 family transcriptional regulator [Gammaproteobacteria bacterium]|nr:Rrf2 family transcriptional regulator [Gammaproteobacteria bacterium]
MRLMTFTDYCLRVLIYLAIEPDRRATIAEIATAFDISQNHLMKVVHVLGRHKLLTNVRGRGGGMQLARPAAEINIGEVVRLSEAGAVPAECFDRSSSACIITPACQFRRILGEAMEAFNGVLDRYTLADLTEQQRRPLARILSVPVPDPRRPRRAP